MRKPKHTPAPWHRNVKPATKYPTVYAGRNTHVAAVIPYRGVKLEEVEHNLTLIMAAPNLLHALQLCREQFNTYLQNHLAKSPPDFDKAATNREFRDMCDAAICQAMGEE